MFVFSTSELRNGKCFVKTDTVSRFGALLKLFTCDSMSTGSSVPVIRLLDLEVTSRDRRSNLEVGNTIRFTNCRTISSTVTEVGRTWWSRIHLVYCDKGNRERTVVPGVDERLTVTDGEPGKVECRVDRWSLVVGKALLLPFPRF